MNSHFNFVFSLHAGLILCTCTIFFSLQLLLNTLNKQVRQFTGSGNTPMVYPLKPVIEEIQKSAEESGDRRTSKMCLGMLKAMRNHPEYNYVAYRKACIS